ncbi:MAG TPA: M14 family zinc carboxypeptidase [Bacteroidales bacterium]|nr:M14 family zinc carboxypeptidase [Bacteroidales bacterium]HSA42120.1 M14 family zinc carboxypeptidase [Bacteroidales bacterium]
MQGKEILPLLSAGIAVEECFTGPDHSLIGDLYQPEVAKITALGYQTEIIQDDLGAYYRIRNEAALKKMKSPGYKPLQPKSSANWPVPAGFSLGSMGGFYTWDEMTSRLDDMVQNYPSLITVKVPAAGDSSVEGRPLYYVKISDNPNQNENENRILYTGMHHAREPIGMQALIFYMYYLLEHYATDPLIQYLVDNTELYFIPVMNPDGYVYNQSMNPFGGGNWRKNRKDNGDGSFGVDLNRNYGYMWGFDDIGSSPDPYSEVFRGTGPFSEPETQVIRDFCNEKQFKIALNYHSFSNLLLFPWGYTSQELPADYAAFQAYAEVMTRQNNYVYGPGATTIYQTNGGSDDWMYGEQQSKPAVLSFTPEVGDGTAGFWPSPELIIPLCQDNMWQNLAAALLTVQFAEVKDASPLFIGTQSFLKYQIRNLGLQTGSFTVGVQPLGNAFQYTGPANIHTNPGYLQLLTDSIPYQLSPAYQPGQPIQYLLSISNGIWTFSDTITKYSGTPQVFFQDSCNNMAAWTGDWATTSSSYHSPDYSITDSPFGPYSSYADLSVTLSDPVDLSNAVMAVLRFYARWDLENGFDYVQVKASADNGFSWIPLHGLYTNPGSVNQAALQPLYDGVQTDWVQEQISLQAFIGQQLKIRFTLISDGGVETDGFYFDDVEIAGLFPAGISHQENGALLQFIPNPASDLVRLVFTNQHFIPGSLACYTAQGRLIQQYQVSDPGFSPDVSSWLPGIYYFKYFSSGGPTYTGKVAIIR